MTAAHRRKAMMLADYARRTFSNPLKAVVEPGIRHAFVLDRQGRGTGHRLPPKAAAEIVALANRMADEVGADR